jgi:hypothetical protein
MCSNRPWQVSKTVAILDIQSTLDPSQAQSISNTDYVIRRFNASSARQIGLIAQQVREILPEIVSEDEKGYLSIGYTAIIPLLVEGIKEQQTTMKEKDAEIISMKKAAGRAGSRFRQASGDDRATTAGDEKFCGLFERPGLQASKGERQGRAEEALTARGARPSVSLRSPTNNRIQKVATRSAPGDFLLARFLRILTLLRLRAGLVSDVGGAIERAFHVIVFGGLAARRRG